MLAEQRYKEISEILEREGSVKTVTLCGILGTSRETVRRDFETMEERNMLKRIHGGAMRMEPAVADELRGAKGISLVLTGGLYKADDFKAAGVPVTVAEERKDMRYGMTLQVTI